MRLFMMPWISLDKIEKSIVIIEEMAELTKAITKQHRAPGPFGFSDSMLEECADVHIMMRQMYYAMNDEDARKYHAFYVQKLKRLAGIVGTDIPRRWIKW